jgi:hypothetical protein
MLAAVAAACLAHAPARAQTQTDDEIGKIRRQIDDIQRTYEGRIEALEKRLDAGQAKPAASPPRGNAFNPDISLILQGRYANLSQDPEGYAIGGFVPSGGEVGPGRRGLGLAESELVFSANADPYFGGTLVAALAPENEVEVENAYLQTLALPGGLSVKAGRFFSRIGYLNEQHPHAWDFVDAPLPYRAFLGGKLGDDGVQAKWVAPTELFIEIGAEAGRGASFPGSDRNKNGAALGTLFAHVGGDAGIEHSWRAGLSHARTSPDNRAYDDADSAGNAVTNAFTGRSRLWVADFVWKWAPEGNPYYRNFKFQTEYFRREEDGSLSFDTAGAALAGDYRSRQSGWYAQAVYQFMPHWRVGARVDRLDSGTTDIGQVNSGALAAEDFPVLQPYGATLRTAMLDWSPSEFSRVRVQFARDKSRPGVTDDQIFVQYILSLGTHGAHTW